MTNLSRHITRSSSSSPKTKVLLVRSPSSTVRSVRPTDQPDQSIRRLIIVIFAILGSLSCLWLTGYLGFRLGFAPIVRVPDLTCSAGDALAHAVRMLTAIPQTIFQAGLFHPLWLMLGFILVAIPAASLGAIRPVVPGGPRPKLEMVISSHTGAIVSILNSVLLFVWAGSSFRSEHIRELPFGVDSIQAWIADLQAVSGLDVLAATAGILWTVVVLRLTIPVWLRSLSAVACFSALVVAIVAMSISNVSSALVQQDRSMFFLDDGSIQPRLAIGSTSQYLATLALRDNAVIVELRNYPATLEVVGKQSLVDFLMPQVDHAE